MEIKEGSIVIIKDELMLHTKPKWGINHEMEDYAEMKTRLKVKEVYSNHIRAYPLNGSGRTFTYHKKDVVLSDIIYLGGE